jgi:hypothetical protein
MLPASRILTSVRMWAFRLNAATDHADADAVVGSGDLFIAAGRGRNKGSGPGEERSSDHISNCIRKACLHSGECGPHTEPNGSGLKAEEDDEDEKGSNDGPSFVIPECGGESAKTADGDDDR